MEYKDKLGEAQKLIEQAKAIVNNKDASQEDRAKVEQMLKDAQALKNEALQLKAILDEGIDIAAAQAVPQNKAAPTEQKGSGAFGSWGEFLEAVFMAGHPNVKSAPDPRLRFFKDKDEEAQANAQSKSKKDMAEAVGATGGFLVPIEQQNVLQGVMGEGSLIRPRATRIPMARRQINLPVLDQTSTTAGVPHWFGGMKFYWAEEASAKTETDANFRQVSLVAHKLIGYTRASDELVDDSAISLDAFLSGPLGFSGGVNWMEDFAFLQGSGAGQPLGVINAGATIGVPRITAAGVTYADLVNMYEAFLPSGSGAWFVSQSVISNLMTMQDPSGQYMWPALFAGAASAGRPPSLLGMPIVFTEKLPRVGTAGDVLLADWRYYLLGDRAATTIESTKFDRWQYDQTSWRVVHRVDGQPWLSTPLTYQDGTTQVSPFVILASKTT